MRNRPPIDLFLRLPSHFRSRDADQGSPLEALLALFADELAHIEQDIDQLYDNWFVETCEPWVLPYIAELVGATPMRDIGPDQAGLTRAYVANVLQYRQGKGTAAVLEQVARDVSGWSVVAVEFFQRLATSQSMNHVRTAAPAFADVRHPGVRSSRSPFSTMAHAPAAGSPTGWSGRYNLPHLGLFIWRHAAAPIWPVEDLGPGYLGGAQPRPDAPDPGLLRFDPLGRDLPLVNRPAPDLTVSARMNARTVPAALSREDLRAALNAARSTGATPGSWFETAPPFRVRLDGAEVSPARLFCCNLEKDSSGAWRRPSQPGEVMVDPVLGRLSLHPADEGKAVETGFAHAQCFAIGGGAYDRSASLAEWLPDVLGDGTTPPWQISVSQRQGLASEDPDQGGPVVASLREAVRRWNSTAGEGSRGIIAILDNATYGEALDDLEAIDHSIQLPKASTLAIVAAAWPLEVDKDGALSRPPRKLSPIHRRPVLLGSVRIAAALAGIDPGGSLVIDGLVISGSLTASDGGDLGALQLYNCTLGADGPSLDGAVSAKGNERLSLVIDRCIVARVSLPSAGGTIAIRRSILGEDRSADVAGPGTSALVLEATKMDATISDSTILGRSCCRTIHAENSILTGRVVVDFHQAGCVRFCYIGANSVVPRRYRCVTAAENPPMPNPVFISTRFQDPGFAQLSLSSAAAILEGAQDGLEMGIGYANREPARRANIRDVVEEFLPVGLATGLIYMPVETQP